MPMPTFILRLNFVVEMSKDGHDVEHKWSKPMLIFDLLGQKLLMSAFLEQIQVFEWGLVQSRQNYMLWLKLQIPT